MSKQLSVIALSITPSKNQSVFMVNTAQGGFAIKREALVKRGIPVDTILSGNPYKFPEPTVAIVTKNVAGDYVFGLNPETGKPNPATQDSSTLHTEGDKAGQPVYKAGEFPKFTTDFNSVRSFVSFQEFKAQLELEKMMKEMA